MTMEKLPGLKRIILMLSLIIMIPGLNSCDIIIDIFEAGVWIGIIVTLVVIALITYIIIKLIQKIL